MSEISKLKEEDNNFNNSSNKDNYSIILDYSYKSTINKNSNNSFLNNKRKKRINSYKDLNNKIFLNDKINANKNKDNNYNKNLSDNKQNNDNINNYKDKIKSYESINDKLEHINSKINQLKYEKDPQKYNNLESNYKQIEKELEELKNESSYLKYKLDEISKKHNYNNKTNQSTTNSIIFNKTSFLNVKKMTNISSIKPYNYQVKNDVNEIGNKNRFQISSISSAFKKKINKQKKLSKINKIRNVWKNQIPLITSFFEKPIYKNKNNNNTLNINLSFNKTFMNDNSIRNVGKLESDINFGTKENILLKNKIFNKSFSKNKFLYKANDKKNKSIELVNELNEKNKLIDMLNKDLVKQNKKA